MGKADARGRWGRPLAVFTAVIFVVSSVFPVGAGLAKNPEAFPNWWGRAWLLLYSLPAWVTVAGTSTVTSGER